MSEMKHLPAVRACEQLAYHQEVSGRRTPFQWRYGDPPASPLVTLEDAFEPLPVSNHSVEIGCPPGRLEAVLAQMDHLLQAHRLAASSIGYGENGLVVTFLHRKDAALFKLFWID